MLRFQSVDVLLPGRPAAAKDQLDRALERADQAIAEARDSVQDLRPPAEKTNDLAGAVQVLGDELATQVCGPDSPQFRVTVEGASRDLHPILSDEVYRITREAVRNAFHHAQSSHIEVEISYEDRLLRVHVRDDGQGINSAILKTGREGHYGLSGMRERAERIGGQLNIWPAPGAGTDIELSIPGSIAYRSSATRRGFRLLRRM